MNDLSDIMDLSDMILEISIELQGELKKKGNGFKHKYFRTEDIIPKVLLKCKQYGIRFQTDFTNEYAKMKLWRRDDPTDTITYRLPILTTGDSNPEKCIQLVGKMQTYYKRYLFIQAFNICEVDELELIDPSAIEKPEKPVHKINRNRVATPKTKPELDDLYIKIRNNCEKFDKCISSQIYAYYDENLITEHDCNILLDMYKAEYGPKGGVIM